MAVQALYLRWRPAAFDEVVGQEHVTYTLRNALSSERVGHAYLFSGPRGTGKTTMARLLAKAVNCLNEDPMMRPCNQCQHCIAVNESRFLDLIEIDAASHTGVDDVRELRDRIAFSPNEGRYKIYIIDEVHRFSGAAFDALLKTIEEPPAHAIFILATTEIHKVPQTILSRCQRFDFRRLSVAEIVSRLHALVDAEGVQAEPSALELIARQATGSLRDAISLLDQLIAQPEDALTLSLAQAILGTATSESVRGLTACIAAGDAAGGLELINQTLDSGTDPRQFASQMVDYLRLVMLVQTGGASLVEASEGPEKVGAIAEQAHQLPRSALLNAIRKFNRAAMDASSGWQPQLPLELAFIESIDALYQAPVEAAPAPAARPAAPKEAPPPELPAAAASTDAEAEPIPAADAPSLDEINARWRDVCKMTRKIDLAAEALLNTAKLYAIDGHTVILQMPSELLRGKIEADHNRQILEKALYQVFGKPLKFRCKVGGGTSAAGSQSREVDDLLAHDSLAAFAVNDLGGTVKRVKKSKNEEKPS